MSYFIKNRNNTHEITHTCGAYCKTKGCGYYTTYDINLKSNIRCYGKTPPEIFTARYYDNLRAFSHYIKGLNMYCPQCGALLCKAESSNAKILAGLAKYGYNVLNYNKAHKSRIVKNNITIGCPTVQFDVTDADTMIHLIKGYHYALKRAISSGYDVKDVSNFRLYICVYDQDDEYKIDTALSFPIEKEDMKDLFRTINNDLCFATDEVLFTIGKVPVIVTVDWKSENPEAVITNAENWENKFGDALLGYMRYYLARHPSKTRKEG